METEKEKGYFLQRLEKDGIGEYNIDEFQQYLIATEPPDKCQEYLEYLRDFEFPLGYEQTNRKYFRRTLVKNLKKFIDFTTNPQEVRS